MRVHPNVYRVAAALLGLLAGCAEPAEPIVEFIQAPREILVVDPATAFVVKAPGPVEALRLDLGETPLKDEALEHLILYRVRAGGVDRQKFRVHEGRLIGRFIPGETYFLLPPLGPLSSSRYDLFCRLAPLASRMTAIDDRFLDPICKVILCPGDPVFADALFDQFPRLQQFEGELLRDELEQIRLLPRGAGDAAFGLICDQCFDRDWDPFPIVPGCFSMEGRWIERGPDLSGRLSGLVVDPANTRRIMASSPGGGAWRSLDAGASWEGPKNHGLADLTVVHLEWDVSKSGRLFASTPSDLYVTTDFGDWWTNLTRQGGVPPPLLPRSHMEDPNPFAQLPDLAGGSLVFWAQPCRGLQYSTDGVTFTQHWPFTGGSTNPDNCIQSMAADPGTGRVYFSTMARSGAPHMFRSTCAWTRSAPCLTWERVGNGLPTSDFIQSVVWDGAPDRLVTAVQQGSSTVLFSTTNGRDWTPFPAQPPASSWSQRALAALGAGRYVVGTVAAYETSDGGRNWGTLFFPGMHADIRVITRVTEPGGEHLLLGADGTGPDGSYANITRWNLPPSGSPTAGTPVGTEGMHTWQLYDVAVFATGASRSERRMFIGSIDNGALCSDDFGGTWKVRGAPSGVTCGDLISITVAPGDPDRVYARSCSSSGFSRSDNAASAARCEDIEWRTIEPMRQHYTPAIWTSRMTAVDPADPDRIVFARFREVGISPDGGESWTLWSLPESAWPVSALIDGEGAIYVGTEDHGIYRSDDDGASWVPFGLNDAPPVAVLAVEHSPAGGAGGTFFAATTDGLFRRLPGGAFERVTAGSGYAVTDVAIDPRCPQRLYAGLGFVGGLSRHRGGVRWSRDNGETFASLTAGHEIHNTPITDVEVDPLDSRYVHVATYGRGTWTYDHMRAPICGAE